MTLPTVVFVGKCVIFPTIVNVGICVSNNIEEALWIEDMSNSFSKLVHSSSYKSSIMFIRVVEWKSCFLHNNLFYPMKKLLINLAC